MAQKNLILTPAPATGLDNQNQLESTFIVYPNPATDHFQIKYYLSASRQVKINITNIAGQIIETLVDEKQNEGAHCIDTKTAHLTAGLYTIRLITELGIETKNIVIQ